MKNKSLIFYIFLIILFFKPYSHAAPLQDRDIEAALSSAELIFKTMKDRNYPTIWYLLTRKSRDTIVDDVYKAEAKAGVQYTKTNIAEDFNNGGLLSQTYWNSFLENFNPDIVLDESKWDIGKFDKDRGEVIIRYRKAEKPAIIQMFKEEGVWKVGLTETFWTRKK